ncbi:MAG: serine hydroxymethyltransferase [candidate division Zixibacteria bacterium]|nr:serine hydroxymethyltransferase [candidate division Zixibacteria bacterium]MDH3938362.1 serine hydroxymethyltransferase [candidate division Zixibacteria bacterium]MDH4035337.1 serine hydroxymethyltransferase [candidate division Zixibacteria bacterium]
MSYLKNADPEIYDAITKETDRQSTKLELIASENFVSEAVLEAMGGVMTNKYAEGYPGKRYYGGCEYVDIAEGLARDRLKQLFNCEHANVQPHSGSQANMAAYFTMLKPGDKVMGLDLNCGGHLTHGHPINFSGFLFDFSGYVVDKVTEQVDYDELLKQAKEVRPKLIVAGASAYPRTIDFGRIRTICDEVEASMMVDIAHIAGLVAAGLHPSPVPYADFVTSTTHKTLRGPRGGIVMCKEQYAADLDRMVMPGIQGGPLMHVIAAKAVAFKEALTDDFKTYQKRIVDNAQAMAAALMDKGHRLVSNGTDTHLMLMSFIDVPKVTGKKVEKALDKAGITANKNTVPFDPEKPFVTSGLRLGTPAVTTRGMGTDAMRTIADFIDRAITNRRKDEMLAAIADEVAALCKDFPLYPERHP